MKWTILVAEGVKWTMLIGGTVLTSFAINVPIEKLFRFFEISPEEAMEIDGDKPFRNLHLSLFVQFAQLGSIVLAYCLVAFVLSLFGLLPGGMKGVVFWP